MYEKLFSKRYKLRPTPEGLMYEEVSERARIGLYHVVEEFFDKKSQQSNKIYQELYRTICVALRTPRDRRVDNEYHASREIERIINNCIYWQFYDICDVLFKAVSSYGNTTDEIEFCKHINILFQEEQLGFELKDDGMIEKRGSAFVDAQIKEVRYLLKEPEFKSADELFEKAIKALNERPKPDAENCIKDAVASVESIGKIIRNDKNARIDNIIKDAIQKGVIPQLLGDPIIKLYAYRGNEPAIAHGGIEPSKVTEDEAEFVLSITAAIILYLVKKRSDLY